MAAAQNVAQKLLGGLMGQTNQTGGSRRHKRKLAGGCADGSCGGAPEAASAISSSPAMVGGAAGAVAGAAAGLAAAGGVQPSDAASSLSASPLTGGGRRHKKTAKASKTKRGGMAGLLSVVETALVPFGLYVGQKVAQRRFSSKRPSSSSYYKRFVKK
jgi:hypothetical protein